MKARHLSEFEDIPKVILKGLFFDLAEWHLGFQYIAKQYQVEGALDVRSIEDSYDLHIVRNAIPAIDLIFINKVISSENLSDVTVSRELTKTV